MSGSINFSEDPVLHVPVNPGTVVANGSVRANNRPYPQYLDITLYESSGRARYDGLQLGFNGRRGPNGPFDFQTSYTLSQTKGHTDANRFGSVNNPFNLEDEYSYTIADQRHRL